MTDEDYMRRALSAAEPGRGRTDFAPSIGCILVKDGKILAEARTSDGGVPHAEATALALAGKAARGATVYVTLEPCATPDPGAQTCCADLLIAAGISRVVMATLDPDHKTNGNGKKKLEAAGIKTSNGLLEEESHAQNPDFYRSRGIPLPPLPGPAGTQCDGRCMAGLPRSPSPEQ